MSDESFRIGLFAAGALLILFAFFLGRIASGPAAARPRYGLQVGVAVAGVAVLAWAGWPYLVGDHAAAVPAPAAAIASATAPVAASSEVDAVSLASQALAACPLAIAPAVPDGNTATRAQMTAARTAFQSYDAATNAYTKCVDAAVDRLNSELRGKVSAAELQRLQGFGTSAHNTAVDQEQAVADKFNGQIRAFKTRHP